MNDVPFPLPDDDRHAFVRFLDFSSGAFHIIGIEAYSSGARETILKFAQAQLPELSFEKIGVHELPGENLWMELQALERSMASNVCWVLWGFERLSSQKDEFHSFFRQLNVQRDLFVRDFPVPWLLFMHPNLARHLRTVAPDFCDFIPTWLQTENEIFFPTSSASSRDTVAWVRDELALENVPVAKAIDQCQAQLLVVESPEDRLPILIRLARLETRRAEYSTALHILDKSWRLAEETHSPEGQSASLSAWAEVLKAQGKYGEAEAYLHRALSIRRDGLHTY